MSFEEEEQQSYFFPHGLDYGGKGQSLQDLLDSADFDFSFAGAPQVARNTQDGHREVFVVDFFHHHEVIKLLTHSETLLKGFRMVLLCFDSTRYAGY
jgi:hypothetical protein